MPLVTFRKPRLFFDVSSLLVSAILVVPALRMLIAISDVGFRISSFSVRASSRRLLRFWGFLILIGCAPLIEAAAPLKPNILFILADDLGYGDVRCLNPNGKIPTPNLDRLAAEGMIFTDAHSSSAVCTPARYGLLTGRYNWRSRLKHDVQGGMSPPLIEAGRLTVPAFLKRNGYDTACVGKWHLGMDWPRKPDTPPFDDNIEKGEHGWRVDFSKPIARGPKSVGFDYFFGIAASLDMVPYTFIENDRVTKLPTEENAFPMMFGRTNRMTRRGPAAAGFAAVDVLPTLKRKAIEYLEQRATNAKRGHPFFLYLPLNAPHTPIAPTKEWQGKSGLNPYADFVMQTDAEVGAVLGALDRLGLVTNTLVIFTSDNGCSPEAKFDELLPKGHNPSAQFRGTKADIFDGGHRIPFLVRWPGRVKAGSRSDQLICLNDLFATCAEILGRKLPENAGEDSVSILPAFEGRATKPLREALVHHSINGSFAIRQGPWKLELCSDSGGWSVPMPGSAAAKQLPTVQLYDLSNAVGETNNVQGAHPEVVARLTKLLEKYVANGRTTPGARQPNTTPVEIRGPTEPAEAAGQPANVLPARSAMKNPANRFAAAGQERPNFLFLFSDDQTFRALGQLGELEEKTPNLDRLARRGMLFTHCFNQGGWSGAVCIPSRTMLNTGRTLWECRGTNDQSIAAGAALWGETLGRAGYDTFMAGKWHIPDAALARSFKTLGPLTGGFLPSTTNGAAAYYRPAPGNPWTPDDPQWKGHWLNVDGRTVHSSVRIADAAIDYLKSRPARSTAPFFMYVAFNAPHDPRQAPRDFLNLYPPNKLKVPPNFLRQHPFLIETNFNGRDEILAPDPRTPEVIRVHLQEYYAIITHLDAQIGRILDALEGSGQAANTVVIFTSDQGLAVGQHGLLGKQNLYDHSLRMPFILAGPGIPKGKRNDALFNMQSLFATTCEMAGVPVPHTVQFPSIVPLITAAKKQLHDSLYAAFLDRQRAVRTEQWKLIRTPHAGAVQLFDVKLDPWEMHNLAADPKHARVLAILDAKLRDLMREMKDPLPEERVFAAAPKTGSVQTTFAPPNIILVMTDDQGYGDLGGTGNPILKTPYIDGFARQSVRFTDFHVSPTCAPTRAALMTGRHEFKNGVTHTINERERMTLKATTIAQVLKKAGYSTGIFGKWHLGDEAEYRPDRRGFDEVFIHGAGGIGQTYAGSCGDAPGNKYFDPAILHNGRFEKTKGYCTDVFFAQAVKWMDEKRRAGRPFFTYIAPNAPHAPLDCPDAYFKRYEGNVPDDAAKFFGMIENIDDNFGALLKKVDEWGLAENTLVIFMTDNGGTAGVKVFNAAMRGGKATPYQGGTRVPAFWRWPARFAGGADCAALTAHIDIFPTLAEIAGVKLNRALAKQVEGRSLLPLLKNPQVAWADRFLVTHVGRWERGQAAKSKFANCSIRDSRFTLVNDKELYDLKTDYAETTNVLAQNPDMAARLRAAYDQWWQEVQPLLVNENATGPTVNPFKALYWKQLGGGPDVALRRQMNPAAQSRGADDAMAPKRQRARP